LKDQKYRRDQKTKITAAFIAHIASAGMLDRRRTIRHISLVLGALLRTSFTQYQRFRASQKFGKIGPLIFFIE
jgi:hypothetical protein